MTRPHVSVIVLISNGEKILMIKRGDSPHKGKWALPGGHLEFGEQLEEAGIREVKEETGVIAKITGFISFKNEIIIEGRKRFHIVLFCFKGKFVKGKLSVGRDVKDVCWKEPKNMNINEIAPSIISFLKMKNFL